ncbi:hypothetical protein HZ994_09145 [Akkermansiaceae bacterium]|nr:hypothetical protein HZ994_09145 [Akkermansiaceae bacterium]
MSPYRMPVLLACLVFSASCGAEDPTADPILDLEKTARFSIVVTEDKVSAGFLAFTGLADGMAESGDLAGITVHGNFTYRENIAEGAPELDWEWDACHTGDNNMTRFMSAKIDETPTVELAPYGSDKSFEFPVSCVGKVGSKKTYREQYHLYENPRGKAKTSVSLTPEVEITASKTIESDYAGFFTVEGEGSSTNSKTLSYDAALVFEFGAAP